MIKITWSFCFVFPAKSQVILLVFHHLAEHHCKIATATEKRLSDRSLLDQCLAIVDVVFWNKNMYDCEANQLAMEKIHKLLRWNLPLQGVTEMKGMAGNFK